MPGRIEDYGIIGDGETVALVTRDGSIDWLCWPSFDSDACFAALLGNDKHGYWRIVPRAESPRLSRRYWPDSLILETRFETDTGVALLIDFMPPRGSASDIVRLVRCESGHVDLHMDMVIRFGFGSYVPWVRRAKDDALLAVCGADMVVLRTPVKLHGKDMTTVADFTIHAGETIPFVMTYAPSHHDVPQPIDAVAALDDTASYWKEWIAQCTYEGAYAEMIRRSLITLKAMIYEPSGGIVAAPTTSLPETLGGARNWDYRFCWLRDATFTLLALMNSGFLHEAAAWHNWLLRSVAGSPAEMQIMYGILGQRRLTEWEADWLPGYEGARPVRIGNAAHAQLQLDVFGELMDVFHQSRMAELQLDGGTWALECALLEHLAKIWDQPDAGIWERRGPGKHYVSSKMLVWVAFDRGVKSAEHFGFKAPVERWRQVRDAVHREVCEKGFDATQNTFVESYGSKWLDASILLMPSIGFLPVSDPRVRGTLEAVERHLVRDGLVMRHGPRGTSHAPKLVEDGQMEGAFLACTLWLADAHVLAGDAVRAQTYFERVVALANDLGLLAEEYDVSARRQTGNFPQALTHIALVNTAHNLVRAAKPAVQRAEG